MIRKMDPSKDAGILSAFKYSSTNDIKYNIKKSTPTAIKKTIKSI